MTMKDFNTVVHMQIGLCENLLTSKGKEYATAAYTGDSTEKAIVTGRPEPDRLLHFKKAAAIINATPKEALLGMLSKHIVSVSDMCTDKETCYTLEKWEEKITDSINYLLILRAIVEEEQRGQN